MKIINTKIKNLKIIYQKNNIDSRGCLRETYNKRLINFDKFIFDYCTTSKYVTVVKGKILDCVIDLRKNSSTFGKVFKIILSEKNCISLYIPKGFAHAFFSFDKINIIYYKLSNYYKPEFEDGIKWNDKKFRSLWPTKKPIVSKKDSKLRTFHEFCKKFKGL